MFYFPRKTLFQLVKKNLSVQIQLEKRIFRPVVLYLKTFSGILNTFSKTNDEQSVLFFLISALLWLKGEKYLE